jgi:SulP family sulfate permease
MHQPGSSGRNFICNLRKPETLERWRGDFFGGTVAALIAVPYGIALALAIGLRPEAGLYTSIIGGTLSGIISDAPVVVSGLSATVVPVLAALVKTHGAGAALAAGALSGLIMALIGFLRLGRFFHYLPQLVIGAFKLIVGVGLGSLAAMLRFSFKHGLHKLSRRTTYRTVSTAIQEESNHDQSATYRST